MISSDQGHKWDKHTEERKGEQKWSQPMWPPVHYQVSHRPYAFLHSRLPPVYLFCSAECVSHFVKLYKAFKERQPKMFRERQATYFLSWRRDFRPDPRYHIQVKFPLHCSRREEDFKLSLVAAGNFLFLGGPVCGIRPDKARLCFLLSVNSRCSLAVKPQGQLAYSPLRKSQAGWNCTNHMSISCPIFT